MTPVSAADRWFPAADRLDRDLALFCLPHAGGSSSAFRGWAAELGHRAGVQVVPAQLPGRETRITEPPQVDVGGLGEALAQAVLQRGDRPYALYGHSMGARLGFAVIRDLRRRGLPLPVRLFVGAARPPHRDVPLTRIGRLPDDEFCARLVAMGGTPPGVLDEPELRALLLPVLRADLNLIESLEFPPEEPLPVPVVAYAGRDDPEAGPGDMVGWSAHTTGGFELHTFPGGHFFLNTARAALLGHLAGHLDAARRTPTVGLTCGEPLRPPDDDEVCVVEARLDDLPDPPEPVRPAGDPDPAAAGQAAGPARTAARQARLRWLVAGLTVLEPDREPAPVLPGEAVRPPDRPRWCTSHSHDVALVALTRGGPVGVHVERIPPVEPDAVGGRVPAGTQRGRAAPAGPCGPADRTDQADKAGQADVLAAAWRRWTARQALRRAQGKRAEPAPADPAGRWADQPEPALPTGWRIWHLDVAEATAAVAVESANLRLRYLTVRRGAR